MEQQPRPFQPPPQDQQQQQQQNQTPQFMLQSRISPPNPLQRPVQPTPMPPFQQTLQQMQARQGVSLHAIPRLRPEEENPLYPGHSNPQAAHNQMLQGQVHAGSPLPSEQLGPIGQRSQFGAQQQIQNLQASRFNQDPYIILHGQQFQERQDFMGIVTPPSAQRNTQPQPNTQLGPRGMALAAQNPALRRIPSQPQLGGGAASNPVFPGNSPTNPSGINSTMMMNGTLQGGQHSSGPISYRPINGIPYPGAGMRIHTQSSDGQGQGLAGSFPRASSEQAPAPRMTPHQQPQMLDLNSNSGGVNGRAPGSMASSSTQTPMYGAQNISSSSMAPPPLRTPFQPQGSLPPSLSRGPSDSPLHSPPAQQHMHNTPVAGSSTTPRLASSRSTPVRGGTQPPNPHPQTFYPPAAPHGVAPPPPNRSQTVTPSSSMPGLEESRDSLQVQIHQQHPSHPPLPHQMTSHLGSHQQPHFQPNEMQRQQLLGRDPFASQQHIPPHSQQPLTSTTNTPSISYARPPSRTQRPSIPSSVPMQHQTSQPPMHHLTPADQHAMFPYRASQFNDDHAMGGSVSAGSAHSQHSQSPRAHPFTPTSGSIAHTSPGSGMMPPSSAPPTQTSFPGRRMTVNGIEQQGPPPHPPQPPASIQATAIQRMPLSAQSSGAIGAGGPPGSVSAPRSSVPPVKPPNTIGSGQGLLRLMEFSHALAGGEKPLDVSYWKTVAHEFLTPGTGSLRLTMWKDAECKSFLITETVFPRFFHSSFCSEVKAITLSLNGVSERCHTANEGTVECMDAAWIYTFTNGYVVTLRGPLTATIHAVPNPFIAGVPPASAGHTLKFHRFEFSSTKIEKHVDLNAIIGVRIKGVASSSQGSGTVVNGKSEPNSNPSSPQFQDLKSGQKAGATKSSTDFAPINIEQAKLPYEPFDDWGLPPATMRCLELAEGIINMNDLMRLSWENTKDLQNVRESIGALASLEKAAQMPDIAEIIASGSHLIPRKPLGESSENGPRHVMVQHLSGAHTAPAASSGSPMNIQSTPQPSHSNVPGTSNSSPMQSDRPTASTSQRSPGNAQSSKAARPNSSSSSSTIPSPTTLVSTIGTKRKANNIDGPFEDNSANTDPPSAAVGRRSRASAAAAAATASPTEGPAHATRATRRKASPPKQMNTRARRRGTGS